MAKDLIEKNFPWLTPWFCHPALNDITLNNDEERILSELSSRWLAEIKLQMFESLAEQFG